MPEYITLKVTAEEFNLITDAVDKTSNHFKYAAWKYTGEGDIKWGYDKKSASWKMSKKLNKINCDLHRQADDPQYKNDCSECNESTLADAFAKVVAYRMSKDKK